MGVQSGKRGRKNLRMRRTILLSTTVGMIFAAPQSNPVWTEVIGEYKGEPLKVVRPTTEAALAFMKDFFGEDLCSSAAQAYMESVLSGESGAKASPGRGWRRASPPTPQLSAPPRLSLEPSPTLPSQATQWWTPPAQRLRKPSSKTLLVPISQLLTPPRPSLTPPCPPAQTATTRSAPTLPPPT